MKKCGRFSLAASTAALLALVTGCASIIVGGMQDISFHTNPADATVFVYNASGAVVAKQNTPCSLRLKRGDGYFRKASYRVVVEKSGFGTFETQLVGQVGGWYIGGNFLFGGLIGWLIVDPITGAMWTLKPTEINASLAGQQSSLRAADDGSLVVMLREHVPADLVASMKPLQVTQ